ncbi:MAG: XamI family restriction endonuclease [Thermoplasmata archaeon]|nr:XamI family restriction endonuclease [Thermoplasmata archaeon]
MMINADKPQLWKQDIVKSVDLFNNWFIKFAPKTYRDTRKQTTEQVINAINLTENLTNITIKSLNDHPEVLPILRMSTSPPLARDRLIGLAHANKNLVKKMEEGVIAVQMDEDELNRNLDKICKIIHELLDTDIFPWLTIKKKPTKLEKERASTIVADRLCGAVANPIIRNAQEQRQLALIGKYLKKLGYKQEYHLSGTPITEIPPGTFSFRMNVPSGKEKNINIPVDVVIQPKKLRRSKLPILIEAKSAGDFTNVNKRRKEEATKMRQLKAAYGSEIQLILFLCGYFDAGYLGYEAAEGLDWIWEHRIEDFKKLRI